MAERPTGAVTFLFTDIEGSTQAWENDPTGMAADLEIHDRILREVIESHGGFVFATGGDSFSAAFSSPTSALTAAAEAQQDLARSDCGLRVRMGVHSGETVERDGNYFGPALNRTARLMSIGHGGQILVSTTTRDLVNAGDFEFIDLGEHRLADLSAPARVAQLVADGLERDFPALRSVVTTDNLPRLGQIFGRDDDIEQVTGLLDQHRLVTLTGAGGIGKTTLAISVATRMIDLFPDGRWLVDLTDLPAGSQQPAVSGAVAGVDDRFGSIEVLAPRRMLLVLDNCEHVLDGVRGYLDDLLDSAADVTVLATSREPLRLRGERALPVAPLSIVEDSDHASAIDLFTTRALEAGVILDLTSHRDTISAICQEVGGLPLAIELAAARTAVMTPSQILDRLSDRLSLLRGGASGPEHHRTIESTIAWSYDLLDDETQRLLRFLSVFEGGFDLEQAEAVGGDGAIDRLTDLVRKSLVHRSDDRFGMLEAVRQYAASQLVIARQADEAERRHARFFAQRAHDIYHRGEVVELANGERQWITQNLANLRQAIQELTDRGEIEHAAEIAAVLWPHWIDVLAEKVDQTDWFAPLLRHLDQLDSQLQMLVLHGSGTIALSSNDLDRATELLQSEYAIHRETGLLPRASVAPQNNLAALAAIRGDWDEAQRLLKESIDTHKVAGRSIEVASSNLSMIAGWVHGDFAEGLAVIQEARALDHLNTAVQIASLRLFEADLLSELGRYDEAEALIAEALPHLRQGSVRVSEQVWALEMLALIAFRRGDIPLSSTLLLEVIDILSLEGMEPLWHRPNCYLLVSLLNQQGEPSLAKRVFAEIRDNSASLTLPVLTQRFDELEAQIIVDSDTTSTYDDLALGDAVRSALEAAID